jgi:hypothetical protein
MFATTVVLVRPNRLETISSKFHAIASLVLVDQNVKKVPICVRKTCVSMANVFQMHWLEARTVRAILAGLDHVAIVKTIANTYTAKTVALALILKTEACASVFQDISELTANIVIVLFVFNHKYWK